MLFSTQWSSDYNSNEDLNMLQYVTGDMLTKSICYQVKK